MNKEHRVLIAGIFTLALSACGGGGQASGGGGSGSSGAAPVADISGTWTINETLGANDCGEPAGSVTTYNLTATMSGNAVTVVTPAGTFSGTLNGNQLRWSGSYAEQGGTTTINNMSLTVSSDGNSINGTVNWSWSDGVDRCSGTTRVDGVRISGGGGGGGGGGGSTAESEPNNTFAQAQPLSGEPVTVTGTVTGTSYSGPDWEDYFLYTPPVAGNYTIRLTSTAGDADLVVYTDSQQEVARSDSGGTDSVVISMPAGSQGYIRVIAWSSTGYTLSISR